LNLYFPSRPFYSSADTIGTIVAIGWVSLSLSNEAPWDLATYISRDAGLTWSQIPLVGPHHFQFADHGAILLMAPMWQSTTVVFYSLDEGLTFTPFTFSAIGNVWVSSISAAGNATSSKFFIHGLIDDGAASGVVFGIDFSFLRNRICVDSDYEIWSPSDGQSQKACWLGNQLQFSRRIRTANCTNTRPHEDLVSSTACECTIEDYECDFGFSPQLSPTGTTNCVLTATNLPPDPPLDCHVNYSSTVGYRLVPGDGCKGGVDLNPHTKSCPIVPPGSGPKSDAWIAVVVILVVLVVIAIVAFFVFRNQETREKILGFFNRANSNSYKRVNRPNRGPLLAANDDDEEDEEAEFGIQDDLLQEEEAHEAKILHDTDISKVSVVSNSPTSSNPRSNTELFNTGT